MYQYDKKKLNKTLQAQIRLSAFLFLEKIKHIHRRQPEEAEGRIWTEIMWLLSLPHLERGVGRHACTLTVMLEQVQCDKNRCGAHTCVFAHSGSCSTQISKQWTFPSFTGLLWFESRWVRDSKRCHQRCGADMRHKRNLWGLGGWQPVVSPTVACFASLLRPL